MILCCAVVEIRIKCARHVSKTKRVLHEMSFVIRRVNSMNIGKKEKKKNIAFARNVIKNGLPSNYYISNNT